MKSKHLIVLLFFVFTQLHQTIAQKGLSIGCSGAYLNSYRVLRTGGDPYFEALNTLRDSVESPLAAMQFSIDGMYVYKNNLNLSFGIGYSNAGYQYIDANKSYGSFRTSRGWTNQIPGVKSYDLTTRLLRVSLPILIGYKLHLGSAGNHALLFRIGFNNHIVLQNKYTVVLKFNDGSKEKEYKAVKDGYIPYNASACANIGYYYQMKRHSVGINLVGDYGISPTGDWGVYPYSYGIGLSYLYALRPQ